MALAGLIEIAVLLALAWFNGKSWFYYAKVRQMGATTAGVVFMIVIGMVVPFLPFVGLVSYRRRQSEYVRLYGSAN